MLSDILKRLKIWARALKTQLILLWLCCRQPDMPWRPRLIALVTLAYAISPIDLIPDFIPVLGFLDDVILLPIGIALALRLIPPPLLRRCQPDAQAMAGQRIRLKSGWLMTVVIVTIWLSLAWWVWTLAVSPLR
jgi:uncharacterized membrane protein YkvA (DUF1232 family)